jgi:hypothetical protein
MYRLASFVQLIVEPDTGQEICETLSGGHAEMLIDDRDVRVIEPR